MDYFPIIRKTQNSQPENPKKFLIVTLEDLMIQMLSIPSKLPLCRV